MTAGTNDRALWVAAQEDYTNALKIAEKAWQTASERIPEDATIQAAAATILIHITKLRSEERIHVRVPPPAATTQTTVAQPSVAGIPACKKCGGAMERGEKRSEKSPDFVCLQQKGDCGSPSKDKKKWYATGQWIDKPATSAPRTAPAGSYDEMPPQLEADGGDDLPF
jgi:hypothetical protein